MSLSCSCDYDNYDPGTVLWQSPEDYTTLTTKRGRKCCSCSEKIAIGDVCCEVPRIKVPDTDIEVKIYGEDGEIPVASFYMCERCADLYFSLKELGYCEQPWEDQRELVAEYAEVHAIT